MIKKLDGAKRFILKGVKWPEKSIADMWGTERKLKLGISGKYADSVHLLK